jgi:hypothetical protein
MKDKIIVSLVMFAHLIGGFFVGYALTDCPDCPDNVIIKARTDGSVAALLFCLPNWQDQKQKEIASQNLMTFISDPYIEHYSPYDTTCYRRSECGEE